MAAAISTTATTLEGQLFEVALAMQSREVAAIAADPDFEPKMTLSSSVEDQSLGISISLDATVGGNGDTVSLAPVPYLPVV